MLQGRYKCGYLRIGDMSSTISLPVCSCCNRHIMPNDKCVKFNCPNCGSVLVWRCQSCREAARNYTCESCNFTGP